MDANEMVARCELTKYETKNLPRLREHIPGQKVITVTTAVMEIDDMNRKGILVATDKGLAFYANKLIGYEFEFYPYGRIRDFGYSKKVLGTQLKFWVRSHGNVELKMIDDTQELRDIITIVNHTTGAFV